MKKILGVLVFTVLSQPVFAMDVYQCSKGFAITVVDENYAEIALTANLGGSPEIPTYVSRDVEIKTEWKTENYTTMAFKDKQKMKLLFAVWGKPENRSSFSMIFNNPDTGAQILDMKCTKIML